MKRILTAIAATVAVATTALVVPTANASTTTKDSKPAVTWCTYTVLAVKLSVRDKPAGKVIGSMRRGEHFRGIYGQNQNGWKYGHPMGSVLKGWVNASHLSNGAFDCS